MHCPNCWYCTECKRKDEFTGPHEIFAPFSEKYDAFLAAKQDERKTVRKAHKTLQKEIEARPKRKLKKGLPPLSEVFF